MIDSMPCGVDAVRSEYQKGYLKGFQEGQAVLASEIIDIIVHMHNVAPEYGVVIDMCALLQFLTELLRRKGITLSGISKENKDGQE